MSMIRQGKDEFVLCNGRNCSCPVVTIKGEFVTITDDWENKVHMTLDQFVVVSQVVDTLNKEGKTK